MLLPCFRKYNFRLLVKTYECIIIYVFCMQSRIQEREAEAKRKREKKDATKKAKSGATVKQIQEEQK